MSSRDESQPHPGPAWPPPHGRPVTPHGRPGTPPGAPPRPPRPPAGQPPVGPPPEHRGTPSSPARVPLPASPPPEPGRRPAVDAGRVPSWGADLGRILVYSLIVAVFSAAIVWLTSTGVVLDQQWETITDIGLFAAIMTLVLGWLLPFLVLEHEREDSGFRRRGLIPLVLVSSVLSTLIFTASSVVWPWIGDFSPESGNLMELAGHHPAGLFATAAMNFTAAMISFAFVCPMATAPVAFMVPRSAPWLGLVGILVGFLGLSTAYGWASLAIALRPPDATGLIVLAVCVPVSAVICIVMVLVAQRTRLPEAGTAARRSGTPARR